MRFGDELAPKLKPERATQREQAATELLAMVEADPKCTENSQLALQPLQHGYQHENEQNEQHPTYS